PCPLMALFPLVTLPGFQPAPILLELPDLERLF
ncbi:MAG: hypothetical protein ACI83P_002098, partial [Janthinobacterium sp.]